MALSKESLIEAAKVRTRAAKRQVGAAKADLAVANSELDTALAEGKTAKVRVAREHTRDAEVAVSEAAKNMDVVEGLLDMDNSGPPANPSAPTSGEGTNDLLKHLGGKKAK
ncbi:MAG: hypothetical protein H0X13_18190 [Ramlibacter sp.]|nr:hypothetical protein [Ramlibacter sp.]